jgi:hypothetical protein
MVDVYWLENVHREHSLLSRGWIAAPVWELREDVPFRRIWNLLLCWMCETLNVRPCGIHNVRFCLQKRNGLGPSLLGVLIKNKMYSE